MMWHSLINRKIRIGKLVKIFYIGSSSLGGANEYLYFIKVFLLLQTLHFLLPKNI